MGDCIEWQRARGTGGYGVVQHRGKQWKVHRLVWTLERGAIPDGLLVCHTCDNPPCINIEHLFLGTHGDNSRDASRKGRLTGQALTECKRGHPFDAANTYIAPNGTRKCRACDLEKHRNAGWWR